MDSLLLNRNESAEYGNITILNTFTLARGRLHECAGRARRSFALILAANTKGSVLWISTQYSTNQLNPIGIEPFTNPGRFVFIKAPAKDDMLWAMENALRSGAVPLVIADLPYFPALTPVRRLHLAAASGSKLGKISPVGLILTPDIGGAQGVETRWTLQPRAQKSYAGWCLSRTKSRNEPPQKWHIMQTLENSFTIARQEH